MKWPGAVTVSAFGGPHAVQFSNAYFGNDHWRKHAPGLKSVEDALSIRRRVLLAVLHGLLQVADAVRSGCCSDGNLYLRGRGRPDLPLVLDVLPTRAPPSRRLGSAAGGRARPRA
mgnify:CR=1 FL=1